MDQARCDIRGKPLVLEPRRQEHNLCEPVWWIMATQPGEPKIVKLREVNQELRLALKECRVALDRCEEMIRRTGQDNRLPE